MTRHIHAILSDAENDAADLFIRDHMHAGGGCIEHIFCNTLEGATFIVRCTTCGDTRDLTNFKPGQERAVVQMSGPQWVAGKINQLKRLS